MNKVSSTGTRVHDKSNLTRKKDPWLYALPFFIILLAISIDIQKPGMQWGQGTMAPQGSIYRQVVFGGTYLMAFILAVRKIGALNRVLSNHWAYIGLLVYILISALWSHFPLQVIVVWVHFTGSFFIAMTAVMAFQRNEEFFFRVLLYFSSIAIVSALLAVVFYPARGIDESGRWMGLTPHPNSLGVLSLIAIWASTCYRYYKRDVRTKVWVRSLILLSFVCLYGSNSMTSTILSVAIVFGVRFVVPMMKEPGARSALKIAAMSFLFAVLIALTYALFPEKLTIDTFFHAIGRTSQLTGRTGLWEAAISAISDRPILGWSFDDMLSLSTVHMVRYSQFHNGYLDLMVRGGIIGFIFGLHILAKSIYYLLKLRRVRPTLFVLWSAFFVAVLIHNISEASLVISPNLLWLLLSTLYFLLNRDSVTASRPKASRTAGEVNAGPGRPIIMQVQNISGPSR